MRRLPGLTAALLLTAFAGGAIAQNFPSRPVRLVVPLAPGGTNDTLGRIVAGPLGERLGQQFVVDNRPGGNSLIGSAIVARALPDGHTLLIMGAGHSINPSLQRSLPYDTLRDFAPVGLVGGGPYLLVVHPSVPAQAAKEFVAWVKGRPGKVNYASAGVGNPTHLCGELLNLAAGIDMTHVPYKGGGAVLPDLVAGRVSAFFSSISTTQAHVQAGRLRSIAVTTVQRTPFLPEVPTFVEAGFPGVVVNAWYGILATGGTPRAIVDRLSDELRKVLAEPAVRDQITKRGISPEATTASEFDKLIRADMVKWAKVVKAAGIQPE
ncbi:MAG: tripartite tricarboxylate transporter substrate binding protein [Burkholderiales bacterium]|nr:tripartite tricarboxylate transporter substrate binding protein [Burkholderiales bacterium]